MNQTPKTNQTTDDPFDTLLTLEDTLYTTAYTSGVTAGALAGRIEGRIFGLEKGFEKFTALGELHGRSVVWGSRVLSPKKDAKASNNTEDTEGQNALPTLPSTNRLKNNVTLLHSLTDPLTFSTDNTEEAVADFDDRIKRAGAKAKVIERMIGESDAAAAMSPDGSSGQGRTRNMRLDEGGKKSGDNMEDFSGSRLVR